MSIFTDYYQFVNIAGIKTRYDVSASTQSYHLFERLLLNKSGGHTIYLSDRSVNWKGSGERRTDKVLSQKRQNISSLYIPDPAIHIAYGDIKGTEDAFLVLFEDCWKSFALYICRGQKNNKLNIYQLVCDNEYADEMFHLEEIAIKLSVKPVQSHKLINS